MCQKMVGILFCSLILGDEIAKWLLQRVWLLTYYDGIIAKCKVTVFEIPVYKIVMEVFACKLVLPAGWDGN